MSWSADNLAVFDGDAVRSGLGFDACIPLMRDAMAALSAGRTAQHLRSILDLAPGKIMGIMPGSLGENAIFGAKLLGVFGDPALPGRSTHQGLVILFDGDNAHPLCVADAEAITEIRTAATSAMATDLLARPDAADLAVLGCGLQAGAHVAAIAAVRPLKRVTIWGRDPQRAKTLADALGGDPRFADIAFRTAASVAEATATADIVCTVTNASEPFLSASDVARGTHVNLVGSSGLGKVEAADDLVAAAHFFADYRPAILEQGAEFVGARSRGLVDDSHIAGEIGEVINGTVAGRSDDGDITVFKSIGHVVQDLAAAEYLYRRAAGGRERP